ncbi:retrotransposon protein, putative, ty1-copia subclass [Tanacetum coccineum]|uniref:Retrotransposon protein, putative, ty1-copia subclass n=1 Tax=Tanacetum coccineum TaxID=301880 RepID=A0ABQ5IS37_9ASTR
MSVELNASVKEKDSLAQFKPLHALRVGLLDHRHCPGRRNKCGSRTMNMNSSRISDEKKTPMEMWSGHPSDYGMLRDFRLVRISHKKQVTSRNVVFNESVMYKDTLKDSGSDQIGQEDGDDEDVGDHETDQTPDLTDYQLARDRERRTRTKPLRYAKFLEKNLLSKEISGRAKELEEIQDEDRSPSEKISDIPIEVEGFEPPQEEVVPIRRKGFTQTYGVDYEETFSPVADIRAIRILIAILAFYDYVIWKMDVKTAFLNGYLNKDIYMVQPEGFVDPNHPRKYASFKDPFIVISKHQESGIKDLIRKSKESRRTTLDYYENHSKYLRNTKDMFLVYGGNPKAKLRVDCYCNVGFETDKDDTKSQR